MGGGIRFFVSGATLGGRGFFFIFFGFLFMLKYVYFIHIPTSDFAQSVTISLLLEVLFQKKFKYTNFISFKQFLLLQCCILPHPLELVLMNVS